MTDPKYSYSDDIFHIYHPLYVITLKPFRDPDLTLKGHPRSTYYIPYERQYMTLYSMLTVSIPLKCVFKELQPVEIVDLTPLTFDLQRVFKL